MLGIFITGCFQQEKSEPPISNEAAQNITELTGQDIIHQAAWDVVQKMGEKI